MSPPNGLQRVAELNSKIRRTREFTNVLKASPSSSHRDELIAILEESITIYEGLLDRFPLDGVRNRVC